MPKPIAGSRRKRPVGRSPRGTLVVARYQGEKRSAAYTLSVVANDNDKTSLRMGVEVPIPQTVFSSSKEGTANAPVMSYSYRSVGQHRLLGPHDRRRCLQAGSRRPGFVRLRD